MNFPDDDNGDVLRRMQAGGDNFSIPRDVNFSVVFANKSSAEKFAEHFRGLGYKVSVEFTETASELPWDATVVKHMELSYDAIVGFEDELEAFASSLGGGNDGWGCFSQNSNPQA